MADDPTPQRTPHPGESVTEYRLGQIEQSNRQILRTVESLKDERHNDQQRHQVLVVRVDGLETWKQTVEDASKRTADFSWQIKLAIASAILSPLGALVVAWVVFGKTSP